MKNPCKDCVVRACCGTICPDKENYRTLLQNGLKNLSDYIYSKNGYRRKKIPKHILKQQRVYSAKLSENQIDMQKIRSRGPGSSGM